MKVFNLTKSDFNYKNKILPPNGGSAEFPGLNPPDRDLRLQEAGVLAFGALPGWWIQDRELEKKRREVGMAKIAAAKKVPQKSSDPVVRVVPSVESPAVAAVDERAMVPSSEDKSEDGKKQWGKSRNK